jgi:hypothetical protein
MPKQPYHQKIYIVEMLVLINHNPLARNNKEANIDYFYQNDNIISRIEKKHTSGATNKKKSR